MQDHEWRRVDQLAECHVLNCQDTLRKFEQAKAAMEDKVKDGVYEEMQRAWDRTGLFANETSVKMLLENPLFYDHLLRSYKDEMDVAVSVFYDKAEQYEVPAPTLGRRSARRLETLADTIRDRVLSEKDQLVDLIEQFKDHLPKEGQYKELIEVAHRMYTHVNDGILPLLSATHSVGMHSLRGLDTMHAALNGNTLLIQNLFRSMIEMQRHHERLEGVHVKERVRRSEQIEALTNKAALLTRGCCMLARQRLAKTSEAAALKEDYDDAQQSLYEHVEVERALERQCKALSIELRQRDVHIQTLNANTTIALEAIRESSLTVAQQNELFCAIARKRAAHDAVSKMTAGRGEAVAKMTTLEQLRAAQNPSVALLSAECRKRRLHDEAEETARAQGGDAGAVNRFVAKRAKTIPTDAEVETLLQTTMQQAKQELPEGRASPSESDADE